MVTGLRCSNGTPVNPNTLFTKCAYVQQEDLFMCNLTVSEHLVFQVVIKTFTKNDACGDIFKIHGKNCLETIYSRIKEF